MDTLDTVNYTVCKLLSVNLNNSGCIFDIFLILIYLPLQKQYQENLKLQVHLQAYDL